jgi:hypothetical protein
MSEGLLSIRGKGPCQLPGGASQRATRLFGAALIGIGAMALMAPSHHRQGYGPLGTLGVRHQGSLVRNLAAASSGG